MRLLRIARTELARVSGLRWGRVAVLAMVATPALYAGLHLYADHDPYGGLARVPAGLVIEDTGAATSAGDELNAGEEIAASFLAKGEFDWRRIDRPAAERGVADGTLTFALVVPRDFSAGLVGAAVAEPGAAGIEMIARDPQAYPAVAIADVLVGSVRAALADRVSDAAADTFVIGVAGADIDELIAGASRIAEGLGTLNGTAEDLSADATKLGEDSGRLKTTADGLRDDVGQAADAIGRLPADARRVATDARDSAAGDGRASRSAQSAATAARAARTRADSARGLLGDQLDRAGAAGAERTKAMEIYDGVLGRVRTADDRAATARRQVARIADGTGRVATGASSLATSATGAVDDLTRADQAASDVATQAGTVADAAGRVSGAGAGLSDELRGLVDTAGVLHSTLQRSAGETSQTATDTRSRIAATVASPVTTQASGETLSHARGARSVPWLLTFAVWAGAYVLYLRLRAVPQRMVLADPYRWNGAIAGWLPGLLLGVGQAVVLLVVVAATLRIAPLPTLWTLLFLLLVVAAFVAIVHACNALWGRAGQVAILAAIIVQAVVAGGVLPWQTVPVPLQWIHQVLPSGWAIDGFGRLLHGHAGTGLLLDVAVLAGYLVVALGLVAWVVGQRRVWTPGQIPPVLAA